MEKAQGVKKGYVRVSAASQLLNSSLDSQRNRIEKEGVLPENIVEEVGSAATIFGRPKLVKLLEDVSEGDTLIVTTMDRFSRRILDTIFGINKIYAKGAFFRSLDFPRVCDWANAQDIFQTVIFAFLAEVELSNRSARTRAGIEKAKLIRGKYVGRKSKINPTLLKKVKDYQQRGFAPREICSLLSIGRSTFYKARKKLMEEKL